MTLNIDIFSCPDYPRHRNIESSHGASLWKLIESRPPLGSSYVWVSKSINLVSLEYINALVLFFLMHFRPQCCMGSLPRLSFWSTASQVSEISKKGTGKWKYKAFCNHKMSALNIDVVTITPIQFAGGPMVVFGIKSANAKETGWVHFGVHMQNSACR